MRVRRYSEDAAAAAAAESRGAASPNLTITATMVPPTEPCTLNPAP